MFKLEMPYERIMEEKEDVAFRAPCKCNTTKNDYTLTRFKGFGCQCSCIGDLNRSTNHGIAYNK